MQLMNENFFEKQQRKADQATASTKNGDYDFADLTPEVVLDAIHSLGYQEDGRMLALNSYENRVYQLGMEDGPPLIAKFYRPGRWSNQQIQEEHDFLRELALHEIPVIAPLTAVDQETTLHHYQHFRFAIFPRQGGRAPELDAPDTLQWLGRYLGRIHALGASKTFEFRPELNPIEFGEKPLKYLVDEACLPKDLSEAYQSIARQMLDKVRGAFDAVGDYARVRLHGDCHLGNVLWLEASGGGSSAGPHFLDFDDSRSGPEVQDLWMLLSGSRREMQDQLCDLLEGYQEFCDFDTRQLRLIEPLRCLRLLHYSAWLAQRWNDPAFQLAFPWFGTQHYWQDRILEMREQVALLDEPPLQV